MLERNVEQQKPLVAYDVDSKIFALIHYQWSLAEKIVLLLKPFKQITVEAIKQETTLSFNIPIIEILIYFCQKQKLAIHLAEFI